MTRTPLRIGVIGTGNVAHQHLTGYGMALGDAAEVVAAADPRADVLDEFADRYRIPGRYPSAERLIAEAAPDILVMLTPPAVRDEIIYPAMEGGVHLMVEKPFAVTGARAVEYVEAAERAGVRLAVGQNFRWFPEHQWLHERLRGDDVGRVDHLEARSFQNRPQPPGVWRAEQTKLEMAIFSVHLIDRLQWLAPGAPIAVSAATRRDPDGDLPGEQFSTLIVRFDHDVIATMTSSWMSKRLPINEVRVDASTGSARAWRTEPMRGTGFGVAEFSGATEEANFPEEEHRPHGPLTYGLSVRAFVDAIADGRDAPHSGRDNLRTMGIMEAAYLSAERGGALVTTEEALGGHRLTPTAP